MARNRRSPLLAYLLLIITFTVTLVPSSAVHIGPRLATHGAHKTKTIATKAGHKKSPTARKSRQKNTPAKSTHSAFKSLRNNNRSSSPTQIVSKRKRKSSKTAQNASNPKNKSKSSTRIAANRKRISIASLRKSQKVASRKVAIKINTSHYMRHAPSFDRTPYNARISRTINGAFKSGDSGHYTPQQLVKAGVFQHYPLTGGIFKRKEKVKHVILHSTETAKTADAKRVIRSWNNRGLRHPGAQYVVDRDGSIYQTVDPTYATVHVNINRTRLGVNNDNSIGIEIVRTGNQKYTESQLESVVRLVSYLQDRYEIPRQKVLAHGYIQPSDRTDPVGFDWHKFNKDVAFLQDHQTTAFRLKPSSRG